VENKKQKWPKDWGAEPKDWQEWPEKQKRKFVEEAERLRIEGRVEYIKTINECTPKEREALIHVLPQINGGGLYSGPADEITADPVCTVAAVLLIAGVGLMFVLGCIAAFLGK